MSWAFLVGWTICPQTSEGDKLNFPVHDGTPHDRSCCDPHVAFARCSIQPCMNERSNCSSQSGGHGDPGRQAVCHSCQQREFLCVQNSQLAALHPKAVPVEMSDERPVPNRFAPSKWITDLKHPLRIRPTPLAKNPVQNSVFRAGRKGLPSGAMPWPHALSACTCGNCRGALSRRPLKGHLPGAGRHGLKAATFLFANPA